MDRTNQQTGEDSTARQPPATIIAQAQPQSENETTLIDLQAALHQARLRRRRGLWRAAQMYLSPHSEAAQDLPHHERLALARVNLINSLLAQAPQDPESDAASSAIADRTDNLGALIPGVDNAAPRQVSDPMITRPDRYVPFVTNPEFARALQRHRVGTRRRTALSEALSHLQATQAQAIQDEIDNWRNSQEIDLEEMEGLEFTDGNGEEGDDGHDHGDSNDEDEQGDLDFCLELGSGPQEPAHG